MQEAAYSFDSGKQKTGSFGLYNILEFAKTKAERRSRSRLRHGTGAFGKHTNAFTRDDDRDVSMSSARLKTRFLFPGVKGITLCRKLCPN